ncbi:hypothetical protein HNQ59_002319 [Chitinivorax tropicus]|uniref:Putative DNA-binding domain-containing protein n=1 Tax=Chitinivorax tropicus TaxID=714531 RepID=A0A840MV16_9PROT|nr:DNA-binding domain-containing protein [Chitinivorax tropicus]MBB5019021.1 hypothetical protein [Chitinivorax tropicus]
MKLIQLQQHFYDFLRGQPNQFADCVVGTAQFDVAARLHVYAYAYRARLIEALDANFPVMHQLVGDDAFEQMAIDYLACYPPSHFSIRWFGEQLADFLGDTSPYANQPKLIELAQWEWAMTEAFDAANATPMGPNEMANIPVDDWANLHLRFHPSVRRLDLHYNIPPIWKAMVAESDPPALAEQAKATPWLIWRQDITTYFRSLVPAEADALDNARRGLNFGDLCQELCAFVSEDDAPLYAAQYLKTWLNEGLVTGLDVQYR